MKFTIEYPRTAAQRRRWSQEYGLNAIYSGKHWAKRKEDADFWHMMVRAAIHKPKMFREPVEIRFRWDDRLDLDNHAYMRKMIIDSMRGVLIQDDSKPYVARIIDEWGNTGEIVVEVREAK